VSTRQLKRDLHERTRERMQRLISDTFDLYEMADLDSCDAAMSLGDVLLYATARILSSSENSAETIGAIVTVMVRYQRDEISTKELQKFMHRLGTGHD
jgi:hypothetical protein